MGALTWEMAEGTAARLLPLASEAGALEVTQETEAWAKILALARLQLRRVRVVAVVAEVAVQVV